MDLSQGHPIEETSVIWGLGVFLYKLMYYTIHSESESKRVILQSKFQYPNFSLYSDNLKNIVRVLISVSPLRTEYMPTFG